MELDNSLADAHHALAVHETWGEWDWASGERSFQRAIELNPNYAEARAYYSHLLTIVGRHDEALFQIEQALALDPFNALYMALAGEVLIHTGRYDEAIAQYVEALETSPNLPFAHWALSRVHGLKGMLEESLAWERTFLAAIQDREGERALTEGYEEAGYEGAMRRMGDLFAARARKTHTTTFTAATYYLRAGDIDLFFDWLDKAFEARDPRLPYTVSGPLGREHVRDDPRFQDLRRRLNLPL